VGQLHKLLVMVMVKTERQVGFILSLKRQNNHQNKTATEK